MKAIRDVLMGGASGGGYLSDTGHFPVSLSALNSSILPNYCTVDATITTSAACTSATPAGTWKAEEKFNPVTATGWHGPYMQESTVLNTALVGNFALTTHVDPPINVADTVIFDSFSTGSGFASPIILQNPKNIPATLPAVSTDCAPPTSGAVPGTTYVLPAIPDASNINDCIRLVSAGQNGVLDTALSDAAGAERGDDVVLYLRVSDPNIAPDITGCVLTDE